MRHANMRISLNKLVHAGIVNLLRLKAATLPSNDLCFHSALTRPRSKFVISVANFQFTQRQSDAQCWPLLYGVPSIDRGAFTRLYTGVITSSRAISGVTRVRILVWNSECGKTKTK